MEWFKTHVFIAAWASPIIALIGLLIKKTPEGTQVNWSRMMIYVGFLSGIAIIVTPGIDTAARGVSGTLIFMAMGYMIVDSGRRG